MDAHRKHENENNGHGVAVWTGNVGISKHHIKSHISGRVRHHFNISV